MKSKIYSLLMMIICITCIFAGCKKKEKVDPPIDEIPGVEEPITDPVTDPIEEPDEEPVEEPDDQGTQDPEEPDEPTKDDNEDPIDTYKGLTKNDAIALIEEKIDKSEYTIELAEENFSKDGKSYYVYGIKKGTEIFDQNILVEKQSGDLFCMASDKVVLPYSNFKLFDEEKDAICDWNGTFVRKDSKGKETASIDLAQGDINSFELSISAKEKGKTRKIEIGFASIVGNTAVCETDKGETLKFKMKDKELIITEENVKKGTISFEGTYILK